jgi:hypothetical protein
MSDDPENGYGSDIESLPLSSKDSDGSGFTYSRAGSVCKRLAIYKRLVIGLAAVSVLAIVFIGLFSWAAANGGLSPSSSSSTSPCAAAVRHDTLTLFGPLMDNQASWIVEYVRAGRYPCNSANGAKSMAFLRQNSYAWMGLLTSLGVNNQTYTLGMLKAYVDNIKILIDAASACGSCTDSFFGPCDNVTLVNSTAVVLENLRGTWTRFLIKTLYGGKDALLEQDYVWNEYLACTYSYVEAGRLYGIGSTQFYLEAERCQELAHDIGTALDLIALGR